MDNYDANKGFLGLENVAVNAFQFKWYISRIMGNVYNSTATDILI